MDILGYLVSVVIFLLAILYLYRLYRNIYKKGKCINCDSYKSCSKIYKVEIKK